MGIVKKLRKNELNGAPTDTTEVYPITLIDAVYDSDGKSLKDILDEYGGGSGSGGGCNCGDNEGGGSGGNNGGGGTTNPPSSNAAIDVVTVYGHFTSDPAKPTGGVYNLSQKKLTSPPAGWTTSISGLSLPIYVCDGVVDSNGTIHWGTPIKIKADVETPTPPIEVDPSAEYISASFGQAVYKRAPENSVVAKPVGGSFDYEAATFKVLPSGWYATPALAEATRQANETEKYCIWVSYNNYIRIEKDGELYETYDTGWTTPVKYINIDGILDRASENAERIAQKALENGAADLQNALKMLEESGERVAAVVDSINTFYEWQEITYDAERDSANLIATPSGVSSLATLKANCSTSEYYNKIVKIGDKYYKYSATDIEVLTQVAGFQEELNRLNTTVSSMKPDEIRLQASTGFLDDVTWTEVAEPLGIPIAPLNGVLPTTKYSDTNPSGFKYGEYYQITDANGVVRYYRCDYPISTGFLDIMSDNLSLGVTNSKGATSLIHLYIDGEDPDNPISIGEFNADQLVLNGDVIAKSIATKKAVINNKTYLNEDGSVWMSMGTSGASKFNIDGSGQLAGGLISWGTAIPAYNKPAGAFGLSVKGYIEALGGYIGNAESGWEIANTSTGGCHMIGTDGSGNYIYLNPTKGISQHSNDVNDDAWNLQLDGSGRIAYGSIWWNKKEDNDDWYLYFGQESIGGGKHLVAAEINARDGSGYIALNNIRWTAGGTLEFGDPDNIAGMIKADGSGYMALNRMRWNTEGDIMLGAIDNQEGTVTTVDSSGFIRFENGGDRTSRTTTITNQEIRMFSENLKGTNVGRQAIYDSAGVRLSRNENGNDSAYLNLNCASSSAKLELGYNSSDPSKTSIVTLSTSGLIMKGRQVTLCQMSLSGTVLTITEI